MKQVYHTICCLSILFLTLFCDSQKTGKIYDIIDVVRLKSGYTDTLQISDLFYAGQYNFTFKENPHIQTVFDKISGQVLFSPKNGFTGLTTIQISNDNESYQLPVVVKKLTPHTFFYKPKKGTESVRVIGSFNTWNRRSKPMEDPDGDGIFEKTFWLDNGRYEYLFFADEQEIIDPQNQQKVMNPFGKYNSLLEINSDIQPTYLLKMGYSKRGSDITFNFTYDSDDDKPIIKEDIVCFLNNKRLSADYFNINQSKIAVTLNLDNIPLKSLIRIAVKHEGSATPFQYIKINNRKVVGLDKKEFSWNDAIIYSIMVDRFFDGDPSNTIKVKHPEIEDKANYHGGDLQGIIQKMDEGYFKNLGVNVLWLSPVIQNPFDAYKEYPAPNRYYSGYHGYWPIDPEKVDERFGDMGLLQELVEKAHLQNMKIILDFVSNHVHQEHPFYIEHPEWFGSLELPDGRKNLRFWDEYRLTTWFEPYLPSFDYLKSDEALQVMTDNAVWWLEKTNADGFRQDAVKHVPNKFWRTLTRKIKEEIEIPQDREIFQVGETFGSYELIKSYVNNGQLSSQFNFNLYDAALYTFLNPDAGFNVIETELQKTFEVYGMFHMMGNLMDSHDKLRFMAAADGDIGPESGEPGEIGWTNPPQVDNIQSYQRARLYLAYMMTIPGIPTLYYGDEIGMTGATDPDNRRPMLFGAQLNPDQQEMLKETSKILALRQNNSALRNGDFRTIYLEKDVFAYLRSDMLQKILIVLNKSEEDKFVEIKMPEKYQFKSIIPLYGVNRYSFIDNILSADIDPLSAEVFLVN